MAELVDALDSKSGFRKEVQVRFLFWALLKKLKTPVNIHFQGFFVVGPKVNPMLDLSRNYMPCFMSSKTNQPFCILQISLFHI